MPDRGSVMFSVAYPYYLDAIDRDQVDGLLSLVEVVPPFRGHSNFGDILEGPKGGAE